MNKSWNTPEHAVTEQFWPSSEILYNHKLMINLDLVN